ncbi:MAG: oxidoreductase [Geodermatophilaceae bacterium]|nr:oxidoreductase [Geodermatophilaceae bacterium]
MTATDPLQPLLGLPGVAAAAAHARTDIDRLLAHRVLRRQSAPVSAESALRGARASAALSGSAYQLEAVRAGGVEDVVLAGALRVSAALGGFVDTWNRAPLQVLARLHVLAAADLTSANRLGRPTGDPAVGARLAALAGLLTAVSDVPAVVLAAVVHGELLAIAPFGSADGVVARAAYRLTLVGRGLDPKSVSVPEVGHVELGREYDDALAGYRSGDAGGVAAWVRHCCAAVGLGAQEGLAVCEAIRRGASE